MKRIVAMMTALALLLGCGAALAEETYETPLTELTERYGFRLGTCLSYEQLRNQKYLDLVRNSYPHSAFEQTNKYGLQMFYTAGFDNVFYCDALECFIVLEQENGVCLQSVLCGKRIALKDVIRRIESEDCKIRLGFVPLDEDMVICESEIYDGADDYRLFYMGEELESIEKERLYFPDLSHA